tara:strand:- start:211 stop:1191 length:981 start_codon:yes stop_codon:yes gene_type:complete
MNILITGGLGLIGSNLLKRLISNKHYKIKIVDNLWRGKIENIYENNEPLLDLDKNFYKLDLTNYENCLKVTENIDLVIHLADIVSGIKFVFANEPFVFRNNLLINSNVLTASIKNKVSKILYLGTACSYPAEKQSYINPPPFVESETYPANPESSYGWSKLMGEYEIELASKYNLIDACILRLYNVYGPPCDLDPEKSQVIPSLCRKILEAKNDEIDVWGSGKQKRSFVFIDDVIEGILLGLEKGFNKGVIQLGSSTSHSIEYIANYLISLTNKNVNINFDTSKPEGDKDRMADCSKANKILGWKQKIDLNQGLEKTLKWVRDKLA